LPQPCKHHPVNTTLLPPLCCHHFATTFLPLCHHHFVAILLPFHYHHFFTTITTTLLPPLSLRFFAPEHCEKALHCLQEFVTTAKKH